MVLATKILCCNATALSFDKWFQWRNQATKLFWGEYVPCHRICNSPVRTFLQRSEGTSWGCFQKIGFLTGNNKEWRNYLPYWYLGFFCRCQFMWEMEQTNSHQICQYCEVMHRICDNTHRLSNKMGFKATNAKIVKYYWIQVHISITVIMILHSSYVNST